MNTSSFNDQHIRQQQQNFIHNTTSSTSTFSPQALYGNHNMMGGDLVAGVVPAVTVVLEGRSICHRISLHKHESYQSLAKALRKIFVQDNAEEEQEQGGGSDEGNDGVDLSNAIPGHLVAYEDLENDLLLAGDLNWK